MDGFLVVLLPELARHVYVVVSERFANRWSVQPPVDFDFPAADLREDVNHLLDLERFKLFDDIVDCCVDILLVRERVIDLYRPHELHELAPEERP